MCTLITAQSVLVNTSVLFGLLYEMREKINAASSRQIKLPFVTCGKDQLVSEKTTHKQQQLKNL